MSNSPPRRPLHARSESETNRTAAVRLVPPEPPQLLGSTDEFQEDDINDDIYSRTALPTSPAHILSPGPAIGNDQYFYGEQGSDSGEFQNAPNAHPPSATYNSTSASPSHSPSQSIESATGSHTSKVRPRSKSAKHLVVDGDGKTFSLLPYDVPQPIDDSTSLSTKTSSSSIPNLDRSFTSCTNTESTFTAAPSTSSPEEDRSIAADHISIASQDYQLVGGLRKVPQDFGLEGKAIGLDNPLPPLPETSDADFTNSRTHELFTKPSFQSFISSASEATNYRVYSPIPEVPESDSGSVIASSSWAAPNPNFEPLEKSSSNNSTVIRKHARGDSGSTAEQSNYESLRQSTPSTVIHHLQGSSASTSERSNYQVHEQQSVLEDSDPEDNPLEDSALLEESSVIYRPQHRPYSSAGTSEYSNYQIHDPDTPVSIIRRPEHIPGHRPQLSTSTTGDDSNFELHRSRTVSNADSIFVSSSSSESNYHIIQETREGTPASVIRRPRSRTTSSLERDSDENYIVHEDLSRSASLNSVVTKPGNKYSQESLRIPPLKTKKSRSNDNFGYYKSRSRETLKSKSNHSLRSRATSLVSLSTIYTQHNAQRAIVTSGSIVNLAATNPPPKPVSSWADIANQTRFHMNETPHVWSSQLSTVPSASESGTDRASRTWSDDNGRRSSVVPSTPSRHSRGSRNVLSISSAPEPDSIEGPQRAYTRAGRGLSSSSIPIINDADEYGDGITEMQDLRNRPSRSGLSGLFSQSSSENLRTSTMRSTTSSRSRTNSLLSNSIPTWAKLYYGSGERGYLRRPGSSASDTLSRTNSYSLCSGSPNTDRFPNTLYSPRRRPRENMTFPHHARGPSVQPSIISIEPAPNAHQGPGRLRTWSIISSVWSPHLRVDRRAARHSVWEPPAVSWSTEGGIFGRRNIQVVLFISGFLLPLTWMLAAVLPLPKVPTLEMREQNEGAGSARNLHAGTINGSSTGVNDFAREFGPLDEARFESAKWWRMLNRWMSVVGLLIIAAVVVLAIEGTQKGW